jgi:hypothetical protein
LFLTSTFRSYGTGVTAKDSSTHAGENGFRHSAQAGRNQALQEAIQTSSTQKELE